MANAITHLTIVHDSRRSVVSKVTDLFGDLAGLGDPGDVGTITVTGTPVAAETLVLGGKVLTFVAASANENEITINADNAIQATNIATIVNANSVLTGVVFATTVAGVVTLRRLTTGRTSLVVTATGVAVSGAAIGPASTARYREFVNALTSDLSGTLMGMQAAQIIARMESGQARATGTITYSGTPVADETLTVNGVVLTFKATSASRAQITISADNTIQARNTVAIINNNPSLIGVVVATSALGVVTVEAVATGFAGHALTLAEAATGTAVSAATLSGVVASATYTVSGTPVADETLTIGGKVLTFKADADTTTENHIAINADNTIQAARIARVINANSVLKGLVSATSAAGVVTVTCTVPGRIGNIISISDAATGVATSAATLSGATATEQVAPITFVAGGV